MKIRNGFVSNSSSSSFIVKLEKDIDDYTLDEFRALCGSVDDHFDPVKQLYNDLKHKEESKRKFSNWEKEEFGYNNLDKFEYYVCYDDDSENMSYMEHDFMPYLDITIRTVNQH